MRRKTLTILLTLTLMLSLSACGRENEPKFGKIGGDSYDQEVTRESASEILQDAQEKTLQSNEPVQYQWNELSFQLPAYVDVVEEEEYLLTFQTDDWSFSGYISQESSSASLEDLQGSLHAVQLSRLMDSFDSKYGEDYQTVIIAGRECQAVTGAVTQNGLNFAVIGAVVPTASHDYEVLILTGEDGSTEAAEMMLDSLQTL